MCSFRQAAWELLSGVADRDAPDDDGRQQQGFVPFLRSFSEHYRWRHNTYLEERKIKSQLVSHRRARRRPEGWSVHFRDWARGTV